MLQYVFDNSLLKISYHIILFSRKVLEISLKISENADFLMKAT